MNKTCATCVYWDTDEDDTDRVIGSCFYFQKIIDAVPYWVASEHDLPVSVTVGSGGKCCNVYEAIE